MKMVILCLVMATAVFSGTSGEMIFEFDPSDENALTAALTKAVGEAYDLNKQGLDALENRQLDAALEHFNNALTILPDYSDAENNRGVVYFRKGNTGEAERIWKALAIKDGTFSPVSYNLGLIALHERRYDEALRLFERSLKGNGRFVEALVRCGTTCLELGRRDKSIEYLRKAYKIAPKHPDTWSFLAYSLVANGDTTEAVNLLKNNDTDVKALRLLGAVESGRKNHTKAAMYLSQAVAKGAQPDLLAELAGLQLESGNCKDALMTVQKYFACPVQHIADAYLTAGIASKECGKSTDAERYFSEGVKRYPSDPILTYNLGQLYFHQKNYTEAEQVWNGLTDSLQDPSLLYLRAIAARRRGDLSGSQKMIEQAIAMDNRAEFHDFLGTVYFQKRETGKAAEEFKKAISINPELRSAQLNLALVASKDQNLGMMIDELLESKKRCSGDSCITIAYQLAIMYYHQKEIQKAVDVLLTIKDAEKDERVYRHIALFYRELQEWDKAIATLESAAKSVVLETQTEYEFAETYLMAGYYSKAVERFLALIPKWTSNPWRLHYQMGYAWLEQNNLDQAQTCFEKSIKSKNDNVAARGLLAFVLNRKGNVDEARKLWEKNLQDDPDNPALWINMGLSLEREKRYEEALSHYKKAVMLNSGNKELQINIGNAYLGQNRFSEAIDAYNGALATPKRNLAAYNIFITSVKKKDKERAQKMLDLLEKEFPGTPFSKRSRAEMALWTGDTAQAKKILEGLTEKDDADWLQLARIHALSGDAEKARNCIGKVSADGAARADIASIEALIAYGKGDFSNAMRLMKDAGDTSFTTQYNIALTAYHAKQFQQSLEIASRLSKSASGTDRADVCRLAGNAAFSLKYWEDARQWYLQLSNVEANNAVVQYNLAVAFYNGGHIEDAWKYYQRAKTFDASIFNKDIEARYRQKKGAAVADSTVFLDSSDIWYNMAVDYQQQSNDSSAELLYKKVIAKDSTNSRTWNNLGAIYGKRGQIENAENAYFKAIEKRHDVPETYSNLVNLYIELEEFKKARVWIIKGLGHNPDSEILASIKERIPLAEEEVKKRKLAEARAAEKSEKK